MPRRYFWFFAAVVAAALPHAAAAQGKRVIAEGKTIAQDNCARCHAIGKKGRSLARNAPAFRDLNKRYKVDDLEEAFVEGVAVRHGEIEMPEFSFTPDRTTALIAYIKSLGRK